MYFEIQQSTVLCVQNEQSSNILQNELTIVKTFKHSSKIVESGSYAYTFFHLLFNNNLYGFNNLYNLSTACYTFNNVHIFDIQQCSVMN